MELSFSCRAALVRQCAATAFWFLAAVGAPSSPVQAQEQERTGRYEDARVFRAYFDDPLIAARAVMSMEALESVYEKGYIVVRATEDDVDALRRAGMRVVEDSPSSMVLRPRQQNLWVSSGSGRAPSA